jgi:hypothetical protein
MDAREAADLRIPFGAGLDRDARCFQLIHHRLEIIHAEIDHPLLLRPPKIFRCGDKRPKDGGACLLMPDRFMHVADAEMFLIPSGE